MSGTMGAGHGDHWQRADDGARTAWALAATNRQLRSHTRSDSGWSLTEAAPDTSDADEGRAAIPSCLARVSHVGTAGQSACSARGAPARRRGALPAEDAARAACCTVRPAGVGEGYRRRGWRRLLMRRLATPCAPAEPPLPATLGWDGSLGPHQAHSAGCRAVFPASRRGRTGSRRRGSEQACLRWNVLKFVKRRIFTLCQRSVTFLRF